MEQLTALLLLLLASLSSVENISKSMKTVLKCEEERREERQERERVRDRRREEVLDTITFQQLGHIIAGDLQGEGPKEQEAPSGDPSGDIETAECRGPRSEWVERDERGTERMSRECFRTELERTETGTWSSWTTIQSRSRIF